MPTLLLADDSLTIQRVVELTFAGEDVEVVSVANGDDAILRIAAIRPDIVFADIAMPRRSGYEVSAFVKGRPDLAHIPVLLLAGAFEPVDQARAAAVRCDGVLIKPFEPKHVIARVRELVGRRPPVELPAAPQPPAPKADSFDDYLDRIDAAFATIEPRQEPAPPGAEAIDRRQTGAPPAAADESLDDYFERLNATPPATPLHPPASAAAARGETPTPDPPEAPIPTLADLIEAPPRAPADARIADALAVALRPGPAAGAPAGPAAGSSGLDAEALVQRVLARVLPDVEARVRRAVQEEMERHNPDYNVRE